MSTTKHLILTERPGTHIEIVNADGRPAIIVTDNYKSTMAYFAPENGAKTALAILEAAGFVGDENMFTGLAVANLRDHIEEQEHITAEAKEQAELEAEALEFYNVGASTVGIEGSEVFYDLRLNDQKVFLAVARKAREMRAEK
ncbi:hypothetical protein [Glutamicibacter sp.]|uniref:hypothetical protein n=1 Tax=Glutamicibacter sp. TaxID=1931995 RepID=UPI003D6BF263